MLNASEYTDSGTPVIAVQDIGENKFHSHKLVLFLKRQPNDLESTVYCQEILFLAERVLSIDGQLLPKVRLVGYKVVTV